MKTIIIENSFILISRTFYNFFPSPLFNQVSMMFNNQTYTRSPEFANARPISGNVHQRLKLNFSAETA